MKLTNDDQIWIPDEDNWKNWSARYEQHPWKKVKLKWLHAWPGRIAIDVGAHVGIWTQRLSEEFIQVICFEPLPKHIECHKENCKDLKNVYLHEVALSNHKGSAMMGTMKSNSGRSSLERNSKLKIEVKTDILDNYEFKKIDFIKIDVEGHELKMLEGAVKTLKKHAPDIFIETFPENKKKTFDFLQNMGYTNTDTFKGSNYYFAK